LLSSALMAGDLRSPTGDAQSQCLAIVDNTARLACFDAAVRAYEAKVASREIVVMDRETMRQTRRGLFGFTLPKTPLFSGDNVRDNVAELDTTVTSAASLGDGKWRMRMEDGAVWENTESVGWKSPKAGSKVHLKAAAFGSYFMTIDRDNPIRAMRVG